MRIGLKTPQIMLNYTKITKNDTSFDKKVTENVILHINTVTKNTLAVNNNYTL